MMQWHSRFHTADGAACLEHGRIQYNILYLAGILGVQQSNTSTIVLCPVASGMTILLYLHNPAGTEPVTCGLW